ncbi:MAG: tetratricopeptide repeat protein, partial [Candidatus Lokiarchaeota archaeon]|nr:tetratricopeptide repeat protein [Candidatus Lokiarchaeota archaeon]
NIENIVDIIKKKKQEIDEIEKLMGKNSEYFQILNELSLILIDTASYEEAEKNFLLCLDFFEKQQDRLGKASIYGILGTLDFKRMEYQKSIDNFNKAYKIYKELNQYTEYITCLKSIGTNYIKLNQLEKSKDIFFDCSRICSESNDIDNFLDCLGNLIFIYEELENWEIVLELYNKSLETFKKIKDNQGIIVSYYNLGILERRLGNYSNALNFFIEGEQIAKISNLIELRLKGLFYIGEIFIYLGRINDSKDQFIKTLYYAKKINAKNMILQVTLLLKSIGLDNHKIEEELEKLKLIKKE